MEKIHRLPLKNQGSKNPLRKRSVKKSFKDQLDPNRTESSEDNGFYPAQMTSIFGDQQEKKNICC
jgi:hypothetical protein